MAELQDYFETLLFRSVEGERFTQDSPVFPEVWLDFATHPGARRDLLLTPTVESSAHELARQLRTQLSHAEDGGPGPGVAHIAANMTTVVASLTFRELIGYVLPMTAWWRHYLRSRRGRALLDLFLEQREVFRAYMIRALEAPSYQAWRATERSDKDSATVKGALTPVVMWLAHVAGTICIAEDAAREAPDGTDTDTQERLHELAASDNEEVATLASSLLELTQATGWRERRDETRRVRQLQALSQDKQRLADGLIQLVANMRYPPRGERPTVADINRNRPTEPTMYRSGKATKSDAVRQVFDVRGKGIRWAVIDSGIDARHIAFRRRDPDGKPLRDEAFTKAKPGSGGGWVNNTRVIATYDFTRIRTLLEGAGGSGIPDEFLVRFSMNQARRPKSARTKQGDLRRALKFGSAIDWRLLDDCLRVPHLEHEDPQLGYRAPQHYHGTHVAGILGADWRADEHDHSPAGDRTGIAPEIELYDLRVLDDDGTGDEFSIMAAMQFVRYLNLRKTGKNQMDVHGANLSFSIRHEVANYACGRTPVCDEAERLVGAGVVVVAAAGNRGRARYQTVKGRPDEGYRSISITDPGNAQSVITVGATHSHEPHTYGVSYFSSRGPTGDGRPKPDLVAPGENIYSTMPGDAEGNTDGTSQATPHVSGAAALLMQRNVELIGRPTRIKEILCSAATDLGRETYFQGAGMLDILRAMQSV